MAEDILAIRRRMLRKMSPEETLILLELADDLKEMAQLAWFDSLANRFERGQHHLGTHLEIDDPNKAQEIANEMAADMRELRNHCVEFDHDRQEVTEERLGDAEKLVARYGGTLELLDRGKIQKDISLN
jgi:hypothetical protein